MLLLLTKASDGYLVDKVVVGKPASASAYFEAVANCVFKGTVSHFVG